MFVDSHFDIEKANLIGDENNNIINASAFSGDVVLEGASGDDILIAGVGNDTLIGGDGFDQLTGGAGADIISGGTQSDILIESTDALSTILTNDTLDQDGEIDTLYDIERADITGGAADNSIDASAFTGVGLLTDLILLNDGEGVGVVDNDDLQISLADGTIVNVNLLTSETLYEVVDHITESHTSLSAELTSQGSIQITDSSTGANQLSCHFNQRLNGSGRFGYR